ncbi:TonB-dependent siderophore receptor [Thiomicrorhabdus sp. Kp2]|uniref:TonB-dependent receptor n=1 Tax=Thiomicrorhabdus sp. Kp2 TaxID=1123518 RepID=UPI0003F67EDE|nr:TonB-dependent receptor [Thiomicrorhabdus sp. Kp2]
MTHQRLSAKKQAANRHNVRFNAQTSLRKPQPKAYATAITIGLATTMAATSVYAQEEVFKLDKLQVEERTSDTNPYAEPGAPYKAKKSGDDRYKRDIADLPKNIQVITKTQIEESGDSDLREILDGMPGITLGTGENGNAFGDRYIIRGQEARSDVFVDGLRDPGMTIRESFATEQVEVSKGPDSSFGGRGTTGGAINSITKQASPDYDFTKLSTGVGSDQHTRVTIDSNHVINQDTAVRANVLYGYEGVPDRDPADRERQGVALSATHTPNNKLTLTGDIYYLKAQDNPDLGSYLDGTVPNRKPVDDAPVYTQDGDFLESEVTTITGRLEYKINEDMKLTNATRFGTTENGYIATGARADGVNALRLSTHNGWQEVDYFVNQTNLHIDKWISGKKHEFLLGAEYSDHKVVNGTYDFNGAATSASGIAFNDYQLNNTLDRSSARKGDWDSDWQIKTLSFSAMDTVDLTDKLTAFAGLRYDIYDYNLKAYWDHDGDGRGGTPSVLDEFKDSSGIWNYHLGATYKIRPNANIYASYATASDINGGESDVGTSSGYGGAAISDGSMSANPEKTTSIELGTKWQFNKGKVLATAAVFHIEKSDVMEGDGYTSTGTYNTGKNEVQGIELGLAGNITDKLSGQVGLTLMKSKILDSAIAANIGKTLSNFADNSASAQLKYQFTDKFDFGGSAKYESVRYAGQPDTAAGYSSTTGEYSQPIPEYWVFDAFANYRFNKNLDVRFNINNLLNEDYYLAGYRSGSFLYKGDARNYRVTLNYDF